MRTHAKYVSVQTVAARIARNYKGIDFDLGDIVEWCFEVIKNIGKYDHFIEYKGVQIEVKNKRAALPCNMYRLLSVVSGGRSCSYSQYYNDGSFLNFSDGVTDGAISIDYIGYMLDEEGYPMIEDSQQEACFWYCLSRIMLEDFLTGKMTGERYGFIEQKYHHYVSTARGDLRWVSREDMAEFQRVSMNVIKSVRYPRSPGSDPRPQ